MKIIDRYIEDVGFHLPRRMQADVEAELRSSIEDTLEDRSQAEGNEVNEEMAAALLKELGSPRKVADSYLPTRYLIGPRMYPIFSLVLKILISIFSVMFVIGLVIKLVDTPLELVSVTKALGLSLGNYINSIFNSIGWVVIILAVIERFFPGVETSEKDEEEKWDPYSLLQVEYPQRIKLWESVMRILVASVLLTVANLYPQWIGVLFNTDGLWSFVPILSVDFAAYLPWLNLLWALSIIFSLVLIRKGEWTSFTRWFYFAIEIYTIGFLFAMVIGNSIIGINPAYLAYHNLTTSDFPSIYNELLPLIRFGADAVMMIIALVSGFSMGSEFYNMIKRNRSKSALSG